MDNPGTVRSPFQRSPAVGTPGKFVIVEIVDLLRRERRPLVLLMAWLCPSLPFALAAFWSLRRLDYVAGGRLGGSAGVLLQLGKLRLQLFDAAILRSELRLEFRDQRLQLGNPLLEPADDAEQLVLNTPLHAEDIGTQSGELYGIFRKFWSGDRLALASAR